MRKQENAQQAMKELRVNEIIYTLQGEGQRKGIASIFIRLSGCSAKYACYASGVKCDTEFNSGKMMNIEEIIEEIRQYNCASIVWTGGEPADQLTDEIVLAFKEAGYYQCIETSGIKPAPKEIDYICVSPKVAEHVLKKNFPKGVEELRYIRHKSQSIPEPEVHSVYKFISPHSDGFDINIENLKHCIELVKENPGWRLSVQDHKLWEIL